MSGYLLPGSSSNATTTIRLYAALLYAAKAMNVESEKDRDHKWTNIGYFNSIQAGKLKLGLSRT